ncbi:hypothetical protein NT04LM_0157, partial [Listeria monocytogenes FSL F2-208]
MSKTLLDNFYISTFLCTLHVKKLPKAIHSLKKKQ